MKGSSTSRRRKDSKHTQLTHPFNRAKVGQIIELEDKYYNKKFDLTLLDKLCTYYTV